MGAPRGPFFVRRLNWVHLRLALMMGVVRLYLEPSDRVPPSMRPHSFVPIIDCNPEQATDLKRRLTRQGYTVFAVPL